MQFDRPNICFVAKIKVDSQYNSKFIKSRVWNSAIVCDMPLYEIYFSVIFRNLRGYKCRVRIKIAEYSSRNIVARVCSFNQNFNV